jgi:hypothetical protein
VKKPAPQPPRQAYPRHTTGDAANDSPNAGGVSGALVQYPCLAKAHILNLWTRIFSVVSCETSWPVEACRGTCFPASGVAPAEGRRATRATRSSPRRRWSWTGSVTRAGAFGCTSSASTCGNTSAGPWGTSRALKALIHVGAGDRRQAEKPLCASQLISDKTHASHRFDSDALRIYPVSVSRGGVADQLGAAGWSSARLLHRDSPRGDPPQVGHRRPVRFGVATITGCGRRADRRSRGPRPTPWPARRRSS